VGARVLGESRASTSRLAGNGVEVHREPAGEELLTLFPYEDESDGGARRAGASLGRACERIQAPPATSRVFSVVAMQAFAAIVLRTRMLLTVSMVGTSFRRRTESSFTSTSTACPSSGVDGGWSSIAVRPTFVSRTWATRSICRPGRTSTRTPPNPANASRSKERPTRSTLIKPSGSGRVSQPRGTRLAEQEWRQTEVNPVALGRHPLSGLRVLSPLSQMRRRNSRMFKDAAGRALKGRDRVSFLSGGQRIRYDLPIRSTQKGKR